MVICIVSWPCQFYEVKWPLMAMWSIAGRLQCDLINGGQWCHYNQTESSCELETLRDDTCCGHLNPRTSCVWSCWWGILCEFSGFVIVIIELNVFCIVKIDVWYCLEQHVSSCFNVTLLNILDNIACHCLSIVFTCNLMPIYWCMYLYFQFHTINTVKHSQHLLWFRELLSLAG